MAHRAHRAMETPVSLAPLVTSRPMLCSARTWVAGSYQRTVGAENGDSKLSVREAIDAHQIDKVQGLAQTLQGKCSNSEGPLRIFVSVAVSRRGLSTGSSREMETTVLTQPACS